ncbi:MAG TPA: DUF547 domain-containing protein [Myxococcota bacterium]|nr:DUF547 domain-containing protein [Myxococcota bacterium]
MRNTGASARGERSARRSWRLIAIALTLAALACAGRAARANAQPTAAQPAAEPARPAFDHGHAAWSAILAQHVVGDSFDYAGLAADRAAFDTYRASLAAVGADEFARWSERERHAFWINAYNAFTIQKVIDHYPLESIRDLDRAFGLSSVFANAFIPLAKLDPQRARSLSLDDIEHGILRPRFADARDHAAINCASVSCPPLRAEAFAAAELERQLDEQMRAFVRDPRRNRLDRERDRLYLSAVFDWFREDFERDAGSVRAYLKRWLPTDAHDFVDRARIEYLDYDWSLNDARRARP